MSCPLTNVGACLALFALAVPAEAREGAPRESQKQAAKDQTVLLRWKVPEGKAIAFKSFMGPVDPKKDGVLKFNIGKLAEGLGLPAEAREKTFALRLPKSASMVSILRGLPNRRLSVKMIVTQVAVPPPSGSKMEDLMADMMRRMQGTVQLRGEITDAGEVSSFYLQSRQKNLLAMLFQLPKERVKVGDSWQLDVNLLEMGHGFICEKASRTNRATLVSLSDTEDGDTLAAIDYCIAESVEGKFMMPMSDKTQPCSMATSFVGRGEFLAKRGTWKRLAARMRTKATGMMSSDADQHMGLEPLAKVPAKLLKLE